MSDPKAVVIKIALLASLLLNVLLALACVFTGTTPGDERFREFSSDAPPRQSQLANRPNTKSPADESVRPQENWWAEMDADDPRQTIANLKKAGFPPTLARRLVVRLHQEKLHNAIWTNLYAYSSVPYWQTPKWRPEKSKADQEEKERRSNEWTKQMMSLRLDADSFTDDPEELASIQQQYGPIPVEKLKEVLRIESRFSERRIDGPLKDQNGADDVAQRNQWQSWQKHLDDEQRAELAAVLSPEEFREYELRRSPTAEILRRQLALFQPTETEYKALFDLHHSLNLQQQTSAATEFGDRQYAIAELYPQVEDLIGPERFQDYKQAMENGSDKLSRLVVRLNLPLATAGKVNAVRDDIVTRAKALTENRQLSPGERKAAKAQLIEEARTKLESTLGGRDGFDAYLDLKGDWIREISEDK